MVSIPITFQSDEKGYFDRECPNEECSYVFKVFMKDWEEKIVNEEAHCPMCGHVDTPDKWYTADQVERMQEIVASWAVNRIQNEFGKKLKELEQSTRHNKFVKISYKPGRRVSFVNNPIGQSEEWETEICCDKCGTRYSVVGAAFFCPCCGYNSASLSFDDAMDSITRMVDSLKEMRSLFLKKYDADAAETMCRSLLESSIGDMIAAFQKFASCKYEELSGQTARVNDFQIVDKGSLLFEEATGHKYNEWLTEAELDYVKVMFQKRHLLEHNNGMVDQKYLDNSHDTKYIVGQRIVINDSDAYTLLRMLRKLSHGIMSIQKQT